VPAGCQTTNGSSPACWWSASERLQNPLDRKITVARVSIVAIHSLLSVATDNNANLPDSVAVTAGRDVLASDIDRSARLRQGDPLHGV
jgi:hypothetical protein